MAIAFVVLSLLTAAGLLYSVSADVFLHDRVVVNMDRAEVPRSWLPALAALRLAGAAGLLAGLGLRAVGISAAAGVVVYFTGAVIAHLRVRWYDVGYPGTYLALATAALTSGVGSWPPTG